MQTVSQKLMSSLPKSNYGAQASTRSLNRLRISCIPFPPAEFRKYVKNDERLQKVMVDIRSSVMKEEHGRNIGQWANAAIEQTSDGPQMVISGYLWAPAQANPGDEMAQETLLASMADPANRQYKCCSIGMRVKGFLRDGEMQNVEDAHVWECSLVDEGKFDGAAVVDVMATKKDQDWVVPINIPLLNKTEEPDMYNVLASIMEQPTQATPPPPAAAAATPAAAAPAAAAPAAPIPAAPTPAAPAAYVASYDPTTGKLLPYEPPATEAPATDTVAPATPAVPAYVAHPIDARLGLTTDLLSTLSPEVLHQLRTVQSARDKTDNEAREKQAAAHAASKKPQIEAMQTAAKLLGHNNPEVLDTLAQLGTQKDKSPMGRFANTVGSLSTAFLSTKESYEASQNENAQLRAQLNRERVATQTVTASAKNAGVLLPSSSSSSTDPYDYQQQDVLATKNASAANSMDQELLEYFGAGKNGPSTLRTEHQTYVDVCASKKRSIAEVNYGYGAPGTEGSSPSASNISRTMFELFDRPQEFSRAVFEK